MIFSTFVDLVGIPMFLTLIFFIVGMISPKTTGDLTYMLIKKKFNRLQIFLFFLFVTWACGMLFYWSGR